MCGIAGIFYTAGDRPADPQQLKRMTDVIRYRGPDAEGFYTKGSLGLGHRRLSIIDLEGGDQPMIDPDTNNVLIYNGEIYNYKEIRDGLRNAGHHFRTESDTEVILKAYAEWGMDCLQRFNGMWSFALWDNKEERLFLARDRLGIKPLNYFFDGDRFVFGSEIKCLFAAGVEKSLNHELLDIYLTFGYVPAPLSFYENVHKLRPGHYLTISRKGMSEHRYWEMPFVDEGQMLTDTNQVHENFEALFRDAVRLRMRSDVPFGAFLSGGLDSASVVTVMSECTDVPIETFTIGFEQDEFDETRLARAVAQQQNTNHHDKIVTPIQFDDALAKIAFHYDEPFGDSSAIPTSDVSEFAAQHVKMVLTGDGGDEVLSGYPGYQVEKFVGRYQRIPASVRSWISKAARASQKLPAGKHAYRFNRIERLARTSSYSFNERLLAKAAWLERSRRRTLLRNYRVIAVEDFLGDFMKACPYKDPFYKLMYFNLKLSLPDDMLTKVDRMSMAHSLEARVPFLDYRLVEYMVRVDKNVKLQGAIRKSVLRNTIGKTLPSALLKASKKGFVVPLREWFKSDAFAPRLDAMVRSGMGLDQKELRTIIEENRRGERDYGNLIWMLLLLDGASDARH